MTDEPVFGAPLPAKTAPVGADERLLRVGIASIWLLTGLLVAHPHYRAIGAQQLDRLGLPHGLMFAACAFEVLLGLRVLLGRATLATTALQVGLVLGFTTILAVSEPMLLVHPFGILSKNVPLLALVVAAYLVEREGWTGRALWLVRGGVAAIWITEGLLPKILFQQPMELEVVARSGLVPIDPSTFLVVMGLLQVASGLAVLVLRGRPLRAVLGAQVLALVALPLLVSFHEPLLWVHPFGPLTKNAPILAGTLIALRRAP